MVEHNVTFENMVLQVPGPIPIAGEDKNNPIIKSSNQNMTVLEPVKTEVLKI